MRYRETLLVKPGRRLLLKDIDPADQGITGPSRLQRMRSNSVAANWQNYSHYSTRRRSGPYSSFCRLWTQGARTE
jgi:hypothetical protein